MPISLADPNEEYTIKRIGGSPEMKKHLKDVTVEVKQDLQGRDRMIFVAHHLV